MQNARSIAQMLGANSFHRFRGEILDANYQTNGQSSGIDWRQLVGIRATTWKCQSKCVLPVGILQYTISN